MSFGLMSAMRLTALSCGEALPPAPACVIAFAFEAMASLLTMTPSMT
jgi:hypothetical protein